MLYINHKVNNDNHQIKTLGAFATRAEADRELAICREGSTDPENIYLSCRSTQDYLFSTGAATP